MPSMCMQCFQPYRPTGNAVCRKADTSGDHQTQQIKSVSDRSHLFSHLLVLIFIDTRNDKCTNGKKVKALRSKED